MSKVLTPVPPPQCPMPGTMKSRTASFALLVFVWISL